MDRGPIGGEDDLARHRAAFDRVRDAPLRTGNRVTLLPEAMDVLAAMWRAMRDARTEIVLEFYTVEDIVVDGQALSALLAARARAGVAVALLYDAVGSEDTPDAFFHGLLAAGVAVLEFRPLDPRRRFFSLDVNDRDHRKILVVDRRIAFLGGTNIDGQYLNPRAAGVPPDRNTRRAFWQDCAASFEGPVVEDVRALFQRGWELHGGRADETAPWRPWSGEPAGPAGETVCVEGSAAREGRPLHLRAMLAGLDAARRTVLLASGYFVPMPQEMRALVDAARRGVDVRLVLPGVSDVMGAVHAARATYGKLIAAGVRVRELDRAVLHAKVSTIDGVWTSIGSSNFDTRSAVMNNEVDAVVLGAATARATEAMMRDWFDAGTEITLADWRARSVHERIGELTALAWKRLM